MLKKMWCWFKRLGLWGTLLLIGGLIIFWFAGQTLLLNWLANYVEKATHGQVVISGLYGQLPGPVFVRQLSYTTKTGSTQVLMRHASLSLSLRDLWNKQITLQNVQAEAIEVSILKHSDAPAELPHSMEIPWPLNIQHAKIATFSYVDSSKHAYIFKRIEGDFITTPSVWNIKVYHSDSPYGLIQGNLTMQSALPYALHGSAKLSGVLHQHPYAWQAQAKGSLADFTVQGAANFAEIKGSVLTQIALFRPDHNSVQQLNLKLNNVQLDKWIDNAPKARLQVNIEAKQQDSQHFFAKLNAHNETVGFIQHLDLPIAQASSDLLWNIHSNRLLFNQAVFSLAKQANRPTGKLFGTILFDGLLNVDLKAEAINLAQLAPNLLPTALNGRVQLKHIPQAKRYQLTGELAQAAYHFSLDSEFDTHTLYAKQLILQRDAQQAKLSGEYAFHPKAFKALGVFTHFDPNAWAESVAADLNGSINIAGVVLPDIQAKVQFDIKNSRLRDYPFLAQGEFNYQHTGKKLNAVNVVAKVADNQLNLQGDLGAQAAKLHYRIHAPNIAQLQADASGSMDAEGDFLGEWAHPSLATRFSAQNLRWKNLSIRKTQGQLQLAQGVQGAANGSVRVEGLQYDQLLFQQVMLDIAGTRQQHEVRLTAQSGGKLFTELRAQGGLLPDWTWQGQLNQLVNQGDYALRLRAPAQLKISPTEQVVEHLQALVFNHIQLDLDFLQLQQGNIRSQGRAENISLEDVLQFQQNKQKINNTLRFNTQWKVNLAETANGQVRIQRTTGDLMILANNKLGVGLSEAWLNVEVNNNQAQLSTHLEGQLLGKVEAQGTIPLVKQGAFWGVAKNAGISLAAELNMSSLAWVNALQKEDTFVLDGALKANLGITGRLDAPIVNGTLQAKKLKLRSVLYGINLQQGEMTANLDNNQLHVSDFQVKSGAGGTLKGQGTLALDSRNPNAQINLVADKLEAVSKPDRLLIVSGQVQATFANKRLRISANVRADKGLLSLDSGDKPTLGDDVVFVGHAQAEQDAASQYQFPTELSLDFDVGEQFKVKGAGIDANLQGKLHLEVVPNKIPRATGALRLKNGTYLAYGQKLKIKQGNLYFNGILANPSLSVLAIRENLPSKIEELGVKVTGTAQQPQAKLVSTPAMTDKEKISWLLFGQDLTSSAQSQTQVALIGAAAASLYNQLNGTDNQVLKNFGIDEISFNTGENTLSKGIVTFGKRLSNKLFFSYGQSIDGKENAFILNYTISSRWSIKAQAGYNNAVDVFYTLFFD